METNSNTLIYENNYKIAHALEAPGYTIRPFNRYNPDHSEWWLIPSTEWPAYRFGKYSIRLNEHDKQPIIGYYVEHGLPLAAQTLPGVKRKFIMQPNWYWHQFIKHMQDGSLVVPINQTLERTGLPLCFRLNIFSQVPDDDDPGAVTSPDVVEFQIKSDEQRLELFHRTDTEYAPLNECQTVEQLGQKLQNLAVLNFPWIDFYIGVRLAYGTRETGAWDAGMIWDNVLKPWEAFVR